MKLSKMEIFCYILADPSTGECLLIDPAFDGDRIVSTVAERGWKVKLVVNTHQHPDHTAGNAYIVQKTGARLGIHEMDARALGSLTGRVISRAFGGRGSPKPDISFRDGDIITLGKCSIRVIHTPGHTPGGVCFYAERNLFTGDTLFVGSIGRTDLPGGSHPRILQSIFEKLYTFAEDTRVWPGHDYGPTPSSTIGWEMKTNPATR